MKIKSVGYNIEGSGEILDDREWIREKTEKTKSGLELQSEQ